MYVLSWRTVSALTRVLIDVYFPCCFTTREINTQITPSWAQKQFVTRVHTLFSMYCIWSQTHRKVIQMRFILASKPIVYDLKIARGDQYHEDNNILLCCWYWSISLLTQAETKWPPFFKTTFSNAFSWMKMLEFRLRFHWNLFRRIQLTKFQHWFR